GEISNPLVVVTARASLDRLMSPEQARSSNWKLGVGDEIQPDKLLLQLVAAGYEGVQVVAGPGEFARRGGIIDISPFGASGSAYRIELLGNEIESLREVDLGTQRSVDLLESVIIGPAHEVLPELPPGGPAALSA